MNTVQRAAYGHVPSFRRESGGLYAVYAAACSRTYGARMRWLHKRGRHARPGDPVCPRCSWCGVPA